MGEFIDAHETVEILGQLAVDRVGVAGE